MSNSYRIRTTPGKDSIVQVNIEQEFEYLEILSLKLLQSDVYTRQCSDYGVVVGRVSINNGFGLPNVKVAVFIPLSDEDSLNPIISEIYPYKTVSDLNDEGYRYNLLPYTKQHSLHTPTGTFLSKEDVLTDPNLIEVYDKYYKFTTTTNDSGDFMLFGVPVGPQTLFFDLDLSDIGEFSLTPNDLIRMGVATESQVNKTTFKASTNLNSLPQIISLSKNIEVSPLWGEEEICSLGINRTDFDLTKESNIELTPTAIFMGSIFSDNDEMMVQKSCKVNKEVGELCTLTTGPGEIRAIRQTIKNDNLGRPILESYQLEGGGQIIDENGTWFTEVPMNMDYITTDEFGNQIISFDPKIGVPTKGRYRFKVKWNQSTSLGDPVRRGYYLVPNVREYGWVGSDPLNKVTSVNGSNSDSYKDFLTSYSFTLNWDDYGYTGSSINSPYYQTGLQHINDAINCEDKFYEFNYNKVYTVSELYTQFRKGFNGRRFIGIKDITNNTCGGEVNKFPVNDAMLRLPIIFVIFNILITLMMPVIYNIVIIMHILAFIFQILIIPLIGYLIYQAGTAAYAHAQGTYLAWPALGLAVVHGALAVLYFGGVVFLTKVFLERKKIQDWFKDFRIPNYTFPDCDMCDCGNSGSQNSNALANTAPQNNTQQKDNNNKIPVNDKGNYYLAPINISNAYSTNDENTLENMKSLMLAGQPTPPNYQKGFDNIGTTCLCRDSACGSDYVLNTFKIGDNPYSAFSTDLPLPERINLFNLKAKYFSNTVPNVNYNDSIAGNLGGRGVNQIKVRFATDINGANSYHLDNVTVLMINGEVSSSFITGDMVTFQNNQKSGDVNSKLKRTNICGLKTITGTSIINQTISTVNVEWADPNGSGVNNVTTYNIKRTDVGDGDCLKSPIDVEYFQIITGMTVDEYITRTSGELENSLISRHIGGVWYMNYLKRFATCNEATIYSGSSVIEQLNNYKTQYIVFLVRGVDPNVDKMKCEYDLSKIFGFKNFGNIVVSGDYKLNIPIQGGPKNVSHIITDNQTVDSYSGQRLFHKSFQFLPGNDMVDFDTTLPNYYSVLDNNNRDTAIVDNNLGVKIESYASTSNDFPSAGPEYDANGNEYTVRWTYKVDNYYRPPVCNPYSKDIIDSDAQNIINTVGITNNQEKFALNTLVKKLKCYTDSVDGKRYWDKFDLLAPLFGNSVSTQKWNIKDLRDTNSAFRLTFNGGTHDSVLGFVGNGTNAFINTHYDLRQKRNGSRKYHMSYYTTNGVTDSGIDMGVLGDQMFLPNSSFFISSKYAAPPWLNPSLPGPSIDGMLLNYRLPEWQYSVGQQPVNDTKGFYMGVYGYWKPSNFPFPTDSAKLFKDGVTINETHAGINIPDNDVYVLALNADGVAARHSKRNVVLVTIGDEFINDIDVKNLNNIFKEFLYNIGRLTTPYSEGGWDEPLVNRANYYPNENIEGGSYLRMWDVNISLPNSSCNDCTTAKTKYYSPRYTDSNKIKIKKVTGVNDNYIVMRSDRLPMSTFDLDFGHGNVRYRPLHANPGLDTFIISQDGEPKVGSGISLGVNNSGDFQDGNNLNSNFDNDVLKSFECSSLVPLDCYYRKDGKIKIQGYGDSCYQSVGEIIMERGCYILVTTPFLSLPNDIVLITEWSRRMVINFAACSNVFSHVFTNNWVSGALYMFPFSNSRFFNEDNEPLSEYCYNSVFLDLRNLNYFYRSSPYKDGVGFIGKKSIDSANKGNEFNLNFPTTIMDLGPRDSYMQELSLTDNYNGYIVDKVKTSTFNDISEILNLLILTRLTNPGFLSKIATSTVMSYFSRNNSFVDADYAQLISINSEFGVSPFNSETYGDGSVYVNPGIDESMYGLFFSSNSQDRDYISPKRIMYSEEGLITNPICFSKFGVKSQEVPFYQWSILPEKLKENADKSIFGAQTNDWLTKYYDGQKFFSNRIQDLDRWSINSRYFRTNSLKTSKYFKGYIYSVDTNGNTSTDVNTWDRNNPETSSVLTGAPYHFYFGLKKGKSAFDRFAKKWLDFEKITD